MNEEQYLQNQHYNNNKQANLPSATTTLVLGIISIVTSICYVSALVGIVCGIIGIVLGNKDRSTYKSLPEFYTSSSYSQSNAGRTCSIIGLILAGLWFLFLIAMFIIVGSIGFTNWR